MVHRSSTYAHVTSSGGRWGTLVLLAPSLVVVTLALLAFVAARFSAPLPAGTSVLLQLLLVAAMLLCLHNSRVVLRSRRLAEVTARQVLEKNQRLERQDAYLRTVIDAVPDVLFAQDAEGRIQMANQATATVLGAPVEELIGRLHSSLSRHSADVDELAEQIRGVLASGVGSATERAAAHPVTGEVRWFETRVVPLFPPSGGPAHALVVATDLTDRKRAEEAVRLSQQQILNRLAEAAEFRDDETGQHTRRVGRLAAQIARMIGLPDDEVELIEHAAPLHDIGKIGIPDSILLKPGRLSNQEFAIMKTHTTIGAKLLSGGSSELMAKAEQIALTHHERWDGSGYPLGLREDENPPAARAVWVADIVDALANDRPYRAAWPVDRIAEELQRQRGEKLDPDCVDACLEIITAKDYVRYTPHAARNAAGSHGPG